jgi:hypothetical protein
MKNMLEQARAAFVEGRARKREARNYVECRALACHASTAHGKPYCADHLHLMPHVAAILGVMRRRELRQERARVLPVG